jgi:hypothetical protein
VPQLKEQLKSRCLTIPKNIIKAELISLLEAHDAAPTTPLQDRPTVATAEDNGVDDEADLRPNFVRHSRPDPFRDRLPGESTATDVARVEPPQAYLDKYAPGIVAAAALFEVDLLIEHSDPQFFALGKGPYSRVTDRELAPATMSNYDTAAGQLWRYCLIRGLYEDMLPLLWPRPPNCPSIRPSTAANFLRFKREKRDTEHEDIDTKARAVDALGLVMVNEGGWQSPHNCDHYAAFISNLHQAMDERDQYLDCCFACRLLPLDEQHRGCKIHKSKPRLFRSGNTAESAMFSRQLVVSKALHGYQELGCTPILPEDVRLIREKLLSSGTIYDLQMYVIIILSISLFLRHDEFHSIKMENFHPEMFEVEINRIQGLALWVQGKADEGRVNFNIPHSDDYPDLCVLRHLLLYVHLSGIKSGSLFPSWAELANGPADGNFKTVMNYATFMKKFTELCLSLPLSEKLIIGTHTLRKTAYLFGVFGRGDYELLRLSGRHKDVKQAEKYCVAAHSLFKRHQRRPQSSNCVMIWTPVREDSNNRNTQRISFASGYMVFRTLHEVAAHFVDVILALPANDPRRDEQSYLLTRGLNYIDSQSNTEKWRHALSECPPHLANNIKALHTAIVEEAAAGGTPAPAVAVTPPNSLITPPFSSRPHASGGASGDTPAKPRTSAAIMDTPALAYKSILVPGYKEVGASTTTREKIERMVVINSWYAKKSNCPAQKYLRSGGENFVKKFLVPVMKCLTHHFGGDVQKFVTTYPDGWKHTTHKAKYCSCRDKDTSCFLETTPDK